MGPDTKEKNMNKTLLALGLLSLYASATEAWASTIKQRECYPSQDLRICLYQDSRVVSDPNAFFILKQKALGNRLWSTQKYAFLAQTMNNLLD